MSTADAAPARPFAKRLVEVAVAVPVLCLIVAEMAGDPSGFARPILLMWVAAIAVVDLLPVPTSVQPIFSLSFPLELAVALIYPPPVAAAVTFIGSSDSRELRGELSFSRAVFNRGQIALSTLGESLIFHSMASIDHSAWFRVVPAVVLATIVGYSINTFAVAYYFHVHSGRPLIHILREMHVGVFGEFLVSYMGLALFSVLVATAVVKIGVWSIAVFIAPLAFARQMFSRTHSLLTATDELAARQADNEYQATHDVLTGLPNRALFQQTLYQAIDRVRGSRGRLGVLLIDLDRFKEINDTLGHHFGDALLREIGPRLSSVLRENDVMARLGGDEFGLLMPDLPDERVAIRICERLIDQMAQPLTVEGLALDVSGSIGIALYPDHSNDADALLRRADVAMYAAKESGGGYELYSSQLDNHNPARLTLMAQVRPGLENDEFILHFQPKVRVSDGRVVGMEALVRWAHPERGLLLPDAFIPLVEKTVLLRPLTMHVLDEALCQWREWANQGRRLDVAVNLSPRSLLDAQLPEQVAEVLDRWGVPPDFLTLELTESFLMAESARSTGVMERLSDFGITLAIDDFGTGYSSLSHLKRLPIREIKIDRSFVMHMRDDSNDLMIVRATVDLGRNLGMRVVAEGVEDEETWRRLAEIGCDEAQGYLWSGPLPAHSFWEWLHGPRETDANSSQGLAATDGERTRPERDRLRAV